MRIGFLYSHLVSNVAYRAEGVARALADQGHDVSIVIHDGKSFDPGPLRRCDVVHIYRVSDQAVRRCIDDLQLRGVAVTWDNDDDVRAMPVEFDRLSKASGFVREREYQNQVKVVRRVDLVTTTSEPLADAFRAAGAARAVRIENYLSPGQLRKPRRARDRIVIGWVAAREHEACDRLLGVSTLLGEALERHQNLHVVTIGVRLALDSDRYEHVTQVPLPKLGDRVRSFDVGIAPLADIPMSYTRSNVKVKEYAAAGVPWVASARGPYVGLGHRQGGVLVQDDEWPQALDALIGSRFKRMRLSRRAAAWGKTQVMDRNVDLWQTAFRQAIDAARERSKAARGTVASPRAS